MNIPLVDLSAQYRDIKEEIDTAIAEVLESAHFVGGPIPARFERNFAHACGVEHCVGVANGTDALYLALRALEIGPGDEVLVPVNTFIATAEAVGLTGARVVFVDVEEESACMDPADAARKVTPATRAIIPVHLYGRPASMDALSALARSHQLVIVEDAAQAHLASWRGRTVGSLGRVACFSFYPGKNLGAYGDAGAVVTGDAELAERVRKLANHGRCTKYQHEIEGVNSRLDAIQAAVLEVKLRHLDQWTRNRRQVAAWYRELLPSGKLVLPSEPQEGGHVYHLFVVRTSLRDRVRQELEAAGIASGIHYPTPLHLLPAYSHLGHRKGDFPMAETLCGEILSLPMYPELSRKQVELVARCLGRSLA